MTLEVELNGLRPDNFDAIRVGFSAETVINRLHRGTSFNAPIPRTNHTLISDTAWLTLEMEAVLCTGGSAA